MSEKITAKSFNSRVKKCPHENGLICRLSTGFTCVCGLEDKEVCTVTRNEKEKFIKQWESKEDE